jgi:CCR4-NOT transcription complex subunit 3
VLHLLLHVSAEIDRVLKKVDEWVELFDEIWEKLYSAEQQNQKEKYEMDLKKEIKKLQRLRDQIKTWIGSSEVKDKDALLEARKLIETKMEQFKICEKETKTKTYSKEGLAREERLDPAEEAKLRTTGWIAEYVERLQELLQEKEFEIEKLSVGKGKKQNKHQIEAFQAQIANHKFHVNKLEGIIRLVNNDRLDCDPVDALKEDLDYYIDSCEDEDYKSAYDEDFFYESLGLEELDVINIDRVTQASSVTSKKSDDSSTSSSKDKKSGKKSAINSVIPMTIGRARAKTDKKGEKEEPEIKVATPAKSAVVGRSISAPSEKSVPAVPQPSAVAPAVRPAPQGGPIAPGASMAAILKRESEQQEKERQQKVGNGFCPKLLDFFFLSTNYPFFFQTVETTGATSATASAAQAARSNATATGGTSTTARSTLTTTTAARGGTSTTTAGRSCNCSTKGYAGSCSKATGGGTVAGAAACSSSCR